jgi:hypothetical protein
VSTTAQSGAHPFEGGTVRERTAFRHVGLHAAGFKLEAARVHDQGVAVGCRCR